jgi:L-lactate dehydrogenase complex protein LldG
MKTARGEILEKLRNTKTSVPEPPDFDAPVYHSIEGPLDEAFKKNLELVNGCVHCFDNEKELFENLSAFLSGYHPETIVCAEPEIKVQLRENNIAFSSLSEISKEMEVGITGCEFLIAHTGSVMVSSAQKGGRQMSVYPPVHVVIALKTQLVDYLEEAYSGIQKKYGRNLPSQISLITGPSRTADIEKTLVMGAHGPRELHVFLW